MYSWPRNQASRESSEKVECYKGVTRVLQGCYKGLRNVLQHCYVLFVHRQNLFFLPLSLLLQHLRSSPVECSKGVTRVFQDGYMGVTSVLQECYKDVTRVLQGWYKGGTVHPLAPLLLPSARLWGVTEVLQGCNTGFGSCNKGVTRLLQGCYKDVTRVLQGCYKGITRVLQHTLLAVLRPHLH
jgi:hypothetical protein